MCVVRWHERESQSKNLAASSKIASMDWRRWKPFSSLLTTMIMMIIICVYFRANYSFCLFPHNLIARWWDAFILNTRGRSRAKLPTRQTWEHQIIIHKKIINEKARTTNFSHYKIFTAFEHFNKQLTVKRFQMYLKQALEIKRMTEVLG